MVNRGAILLFAVLLATGTSRAQAPTGNIAGVLKDSAGAPVAGARLRLTNQDNGLTRSLTTSTDGNYIAAALPPGIYHLTIEAEGFRLLERAATVETGSTNTVNLTLHLGEISEQVTVDAVTPLMQYEHHQVGGLIGRKQIEDLPLNGLNFLELAKLEPGVEPPTRASNSNRNFVPALGQPVGSDGRGTRVTVDGGSIMSVGSGGSAMGFSQGVVREFQIATVNFDLTTGLTNGAAINVSTRSGGNELHGTAFYFFRDHTLAAYPSLNREPANPDPFFQRRQFGFALGGPIRRDRFFFFGTYERNEQRGVGVTTILAPEFLHLNRITPSPFFNPQLSLRLDGKLSEAHTAFIRYSHDGIRTYGGGPKYPSSWLRQPAWADQSIVGLSSVFGDALVNDFRFSYFYVSSTATGVTAEECPGCLGVGAPSINVSQTNLSLGVSSTQNTHARRFHLNDYVTWQRAAHRARFGVDWEYNRGGSLSVNDEPATLTLFPPLRARQAAIPLPSAFLTLDDILQLPLQSVTVGIGDPRVLQENGSLVRSWHTLRLFFQDTWRINSRLTINYGLGWSIDRNLNHDLTKPLLLAPILGNDGLGPTRKQWKNFSPVLGMAWSPRRNGKTVIRAGAGFFYDFFFQNILDTERALLGPPGAGRHTILGSRLSNCLPGIPGVPVGAPLNFNTPTQFTGANLLTCLPAIRAELEQNLANADQSIQAIQLTKQGNLNPVDVPRWSALHINLGVQREVARDFVVSADFAYRHFDHLGLGQLDLNHFNSARGPVIPKCLEGQQNDPNALCSTGAINVQTNAGRATYTGLLVRADKRFSGGFQFLGSWAYSSNTGINAGSTNTANGFNLDDWLSNRGPLENDVTHILNLAGVVQLPWVFRLGFNFSYASAPPFTAFVGGNDFNGDGTTDDLLPGTTVNAFNRSLGRTELESLVSEFNRIYAGKVDGKGAPIQKLALPKQYWFGDNFQSLDLRVSRELVFKERWRLALIGEVFNVYNAANLSGHSGNLTSATFGQPSTRFTQIFGSGGPRAFQFGVRVNF
jgi:hypothetical protein